MLILLKNVKSSTLLLNLSRISSRWTTDESSASMERLKRQKSTQATATAATETISQARFNEIGVQMIDEQLRQYLFKGRQYSKPDESVVKRVKEHLSSFKLDPESTQKPSSDQIKEIPCNFFFTNLNLKHANF